MIENWKRYAIFLLNPFTPSKNGRWRETSSTCCVVPVWVSSQELTFLCARSGIHDFDNRKTKLRLGVRPVAHFFQIMRCYCVLIDRDPMQTIPLCRHPDGAGDASCFICLHASLRKKQRKSRIVPAGINWEYPRSAPEGKPIVKISAITL